MQIRLTPEAAAFLAPSQQALTVSSVVFSSCCSGPLPPAVTPGAPLDPEGFTELRVGPLTVYFDTLLDERPELVIDLQNYGRYRELVLRGWN